MPEHECTGFTVTIKFHTKDASRYLGSTEDVRFRIGDALDRTPAKEEVDYTLEVKRNY